MSEELYTGKNYKSGMIVPADFTLSRFPDLDYEAHKVNFKMYIEELPNGLIGVWLGQPLVTTWEVLKEYLPYFNPKYKNCLVLGHQIMRRVYGYPYEQEDGYDMHHCIPVNGFLALIDADRLRTPMTMEGEFCSEIREFFEMDNYWLRNMNMLVPVTKEVHIRLTQQQKTLDYSVDISSNVKYRCNDYAKYPTNDYYRFYGGESIVNINKCYGAPRFSKWDSW